MSDYGLKEESRAARGEVAQRRAAENLDVQDVINKAVSGKDLTKEEMMALLNVVAVREMTDKIISGQKVRSNDLPILARTLERNMIIALGKKYGNVFVQEWMAANNVEEREAVLRTFTKLHGQLGAEN